MAKPLIVIAGKDVDYLTPLECKFVEELGSNIELEVITSMDYCLSFFAEPHDIEVALICEELYVDDIMRQSIRHLFALTEGQDKGRSIVDSRAESIFKYGSVSTIFNRVLSVCSDLKDKAPSAKSSQIVTFYSPVGGSGKTTAAIATAAILQAEYKQVLYVDVERLQAFGSVLARGQEAPAAMTSALLRSQGNAFDALNSYIMSDSFDYLPPLRQDVGALGISLETFVDFVKNAKASGRYDYVIVDTESSLSGSVAQLLSISDRIVMTGTPAPHDTFKITRLLDNVGAGVKDKCYLLCNKYAGGEQKIGGQVAFEGYVEYDESIQFMTSTKLANVEGFKRLAKALA